MGYSQRLKKDKIDEFTKEREKQTEEEKLFWSFDCKVKYYFTSYNSSKYLNIYIRPTSVISATTGDILSLKFENDSILDLVNIDKFSVGGSNDFVFLSFALSPFIENKLSSNKIKKVRISLSNSGNFNSEIKEVTATTFQKCLALMR